MSQTQPPNPPNPYLKYSNLALQMGVIIGLGAWGGKKLDAYYGTSKPYYTIVLSLLAIVIALYLVLKDFIKPKP
jgi:F0F1-type ATP synthase assembly protein I